MSHGNDLTAPAIACAPAVGEVLDTLAGLPGARIARMSGSGPTCFALFDSAEQAEWAARQLQTARPAWWVAATRLGNAARSPFLTSVSHIGAPLKLPALRGSVALVPPSEVVIIAARSDTNFGSQGHEQ